ncbi:stage VI sporulation protein D [uncultured Metabacillus sp.]|uniref:stage VI sporulation protein D n=1 Tax=uncultured Metabacillus sp. TaxID=2860135 RepID=UPI002615647C|nr:stage VI sporulation protein D [uncultured Metabacillus sp.]
MPQDQEQLRFSVEESVWFQKGQEVFELLTISLEPDITIHEHDQYISIRGALQLSGEYKIDNEAKVEDQKDQYEYANVRYVNEVSTREDGISILNHRFPVDITIPSNRIENLDEVYVAIDSFDYELPELKCLKLVADLSIGGITNKQSQQQVADEVESREEEELEPLYRGEQQEETFEYDSQPSPLPFEQRPSNPFSSLYQEHESAEKDVDKLSLDQVEPIGQLETEDKEEEKESIAASIPRQEESEELYSSQAEDIQEEDIYDPFIVEVRKQEEIEEVTDGPPEIQYSLFSKAENVENEEIQEEAEEKREEESNPKDAHYLTSLFAREDDEDFSRVKMCIVQQGDTIDLICERYEITVQQLMRVNDFHADQDVYEGQILYIPAYSTSK